MAEVMKVQFSLTLKQTMKVCTLKQKVSSGKRRYMHNQNKMHILKSLSGIYALTRGYRRVWWKEIFGLQANDL